jgi:hypothetical protein
MRLLRALLIGLLRLPALIVPLALVAAMAIPAVVLELSTDHEPTTTVLANVARADVVSVALAAVLVAVVFLTFAAVADPVRRGRMSYLLTHAVPRRYVTTYGVELAGEKYSELATWRQWGRRISDHRTYRLAPAASTA